MNKRTARILAKHRANPVRPKSSLKKKIKNFFAFVTLVGLTIGAIGAVYILITFMQISKEMPSIAEIDSIHQNTGTTIYYADGPVMAVLAKRNTQPVQMDQISHYVKWATIAAEDRRFYQHSAIDIRGIIRAAYTNIMSGDLTAEGASTITQQLARNINAFGLSHEKTIRRKIEEAMLAIRLEQIYTKDQILNMYLNNVYYGDGAWGIEAAAETYFKKDAKDLDLAQSAFLAGLPNRPTTLSTNHAAAFRRMDWVLKSMQEIGKITQTQREEALAEDLTLHEKTFITNNIYGAPYFVNYVVSRLEQEYGVSNVYSGWKIYTTLDSRIQKAAEDALHNGIASYGDANQAALICIDPKTGYIRAMVGGLDFNKDQFNITTLGIRQPGSAFKAILYTAAFDNGVCNLNTTFRDDPNFPGELPGNKWHPKNYGGHYSYSNVTVRKAIEDSINTIAVKVAMLTGLKRVIDYAHRMGITTPIAPYPTLALGASGVRPIDLCSAYSIFANNGLRAIPLSVTKIYDSSGNLYDEHVPQVSDPHIGSNAIQEINEALQDVVQYGTGAAARSVPNAHGKTGTTSDDRDAWFAGYTPELTTVIWAAHEVRYTTGKNKGKVRAYLPMPGGTGGRVCAPIWRDFMLKAVPIQQQFNQAAANKNNPGQSNNSNPLSGGNGSSQSSNGSNGNNKDTSSQPAVNSSMNSTQSGQSLDQNPVTPAASGPNSSTSVNNPAPSDNYISQPTPPLPKPRMSEPQGRLTQPPNHNTPTSTDPMVTVPICADSGMLATPWCPTVIMKRMLRSQVPPKCTMHHPPPGEPP